MISSHGHVISMESNTVIRSANIHVFGPCNYSCEHCFDRCLRRTRCMRPEGWLPVLDHLKGEGVTKINFAGGEPTMYPWLEELARIAKGMGFTISIVSNGSLIDGDWIRRFSGLIDWVGLSVDSPDEADEVAIGRHVRGVNHVENVKRVARLAHAAGMRVKLNITAGGGAARRTSSPSSARSGRSASRSSAPSPSRTPTTTARTPGRSPTRSGSRSSGGTPGRP